MDKKKLIKGPNDSIKRRGFTLVEMVIVAPIVILVIGVFIFAIINMVGAVMASRGSNTLAFNVQQALSQIDQDVSASSGYLAVNNVSLTPPQGLNNDTTNFHNANGYVNDVSIGNVLILNSYATTTNPISSTRSYVYVTDKPHACASTLVSQNAKITMNIIYFVKTVNGVSSLWRRVVAPSNFASAGCSVPWQQPSCSPIITDAFCTTKDQELVDGVQPGGFNVSYFVSGSTTANVLAGDATQSDTMRQAAMDPTNTVNVQITAGATMAGRNISQTGSIRSINSNTTYKAPAPSSPVADWLATPQGDHVGNYYDLVTHGWATVSRNTPKTIYDPATQKIYDVPANYLGVRPRSDGKTGNEAVIEESRTNYLLHSHFDVDSNSDGLSDSWTEDGVKSGTPTYSRGTSSIYGTYQRFQYTGVPGDSGSEIRLRQDTGASSFAAGDYATASVWVSGTQTGCSIALRVYARDSGYNTLGFVDKAITLTSSPQLITDIYTNLPANIYKLGFDLRMTSIDPNDTVDVTVSAAQIEKGAFATSYIPTTTATVTRNADDVTVPTTSWNANIGSIFVVAKPETYNSTGQRELVDASYQGGSYPYLFLGFASYTNALRGFVGTDGNISSYSVTPGTYATSAMTWATNNLNTYIDGGVKGTDTSATPGSINTTARLGRGYDGGRYINGTMQRAVIYSSKLSDSDVSIVTNAVKDGP